MGERQKKREEVGGPFLRAVGVHREVQGGENHGHFCHTENEWRGGQAVSPPAHTGKLVQGPYDAFTAGPGNLQTPSASPSQTLTPCAMLLCALGLRVCPKPNILCPWPLL